LCLPAEGDSLANFVIFLAIPLTKPRDLTGPSPRGETDNSVIFSAPGVHCLPGHVQRPWSASAFRWLLASDLSDQSARDPGSQAPKPFQNERTALSSGTRNSTCPGPSACWARHD